MPKSNLRELYDDYPAHTKCKPALPWREFLKTNYFADVPVECQKCSKIFYVQKGRLSIQFNDPTGEKYKARRYSRYETCSKECFFGDERLAFDTNCDICGVEIKKRAQYKDRSKKKARCCSKKCFGKFYSANRKMWKTNGSSRSKFELFLEKYLKDRYSFQIIYNSGDKIGFELDLYIPHIELAIEINGPHHYIPLRGQERLERVIQNDAKKKMLCEQSGIDLFSVNICDQGGHFRPKKQSHHFENIIRKIDATSNVKGFDYYLNEGFEPFVFKLPDPK